MPFPTSNIDWNGSTIMFVVIGPLALLVSGLLLSNNEAALTKNDTEKRLLQDNAFLIRGIGHECFLVGTVAWCSVVNGHSSALARWWPVGLIPSIWNKWISGDQAGALTNAVIALIPLYLGRAQKPAAAAKLAWNGPTIMFVVLGSLALLVSGLLLSNSEAAFAKNETEQRLFKDNAFLIRAVGHECFLVGIVAWCSVVNGHSSALARWWAVGLIPSIWNKWISGDQSGAVTNAVIALISLCLGWAQKAAAPAKRA
jgi:hypothetical protein